MEKTSKKMLSALDSAKKCRIAYADKYDNDESIEILKKMVSFFKTTKKCKSEYENYALDYEARKCILERWASLLESDDDFKDAYLFIANEGNYYYGEFVTKYEVDYILESWLKFTKTIPICKIIYELATEDRLKKIAFEKWNDALIADIPNLKTAGDFEHAYLSAPPKGEARKQIQNSLSAFLIIPEDYKGVFHRQVFKEYDEKFFSDWDEACIKEIPNLKMIGGLKNAYFSAPDKGEARKQIENRLLTFLIKPSDFNKVFHCQVFKEFDENFFSDWNEACIKDIHKLQFSSDFKDAYDFAPPKGEARSLIIEKWMLTLKTPKDCYELYRNYGWGNSFNKQLLSRWECLCIENMPALKTCDDFKCAYKFAPYPGEHRARVLEILVKAADLEISDLVAHKQYEKAYDLSTANEIEIVYDYTMDRDYLLKMGEISSEVAKLWFKSLCDIKDYKEFCNKFYKKYKYDLLYRKAISNWDQLCVKHLETIKRSELSQFLEDVPENGVAMKMIKNALAVIDSNKVMQ